jgi:hypothetical protein
LVSLLFILTSCAFFDEVIKFLMSRTTI